MTWDLVINNIAYAVVPPSQNRTLRRHFNRAQKRRNLTFTLGMNVKQKKVKHWRLACVVLWNTVLACQTLKNAFHTRPVQDGAKSLKATLCLYLQVKFVIVKVIHLTRCSVGASVLIISIRIVLIIIKNIITGDHILDDLRGF